MRQKMDYKVMETTLVLQGNEVNVLDYLMLSGLSSIPNIKKEDYNEIISCLHDIRTQITDIIEKKIKESKQYKP